MTARHETLVGGGRGSAEDGTRDRAAGSDVPAPASSTPPTARAAPSGRKAALAARYRSLFVLGRGGMGSVEAALEVEPASTPGTIEPASTPGTSGERRRERGYERIVALKRLLPDAAHDKRRVDMFLREARLAAMLDHPNVVRAFDYGELDGELYLAMEYVEGQPLSRVLKALSAAEERLPSSVAAWILAEVCRGLHAAHELADPTTGLPLQLVHRDVSPHNVMIGYDGRVRLLDFGVAKIESESATKTGEVKGKTAYMSPEQAMGDPLDRRSDLYSVGAVLYECLTLRRMWGDGTDMEVIRKLALESPPTLDAEPELPKGLAELHARLIAREAKNRPTTAIEVAGDLVPFVDDPVAAAEELRAVLEAHFTEQAREQKEQLNAALHEVAPEQADQLRESMLPSTGRLSTRTRVGRSAAPPPVVAKAIAAPAPPPLKPRAKVPAVFAALAIAVVAIVAWRQVAGPIEASETTVKPAASKIVMVPLVTSAAHPLATPAEAPTAAPPASATTTATPSTSATATSATTASTTATPSTSATTASTTATPSTSTTATTTASARATAATRATGTAPNVPPTTTARPAATPNATAAPSATSASAKTVPAPPTTASAKASDLDEKPF